MADNQIIITIGREYGSLGHLIANDIGKKLGLPVIDKALLNQMAENHGMDPEILKHYDEKRRNPLTSRSRRGHTNSIEDVISEMIFDYMRRLADTGESFIVVGRCGEYVLRDFPGVISIFISGEEEAKTRHIAEVKHISLEEAEALKNKMEARRARYHNYHSDIKFGDVRAYDLVINSTELGVDGSIELICKYIDLWKVKSEDWTEE